MTKIVEMDERVTISAQWEENVGPVILINKFSVNPEDFDQFLKAWAAEAGKFKEQPGFISTQLHRGIGGSGTFVNYAVWESAAHFKKAVNNVMNPVCVSSQHRGISTSIQESCGTWDLYRLNISIQS